MGLSLRRAGCAILLAASMLAVVGAPAVPAASKGPRATIRWTAYGVPHILARDWKGLGYGYGYAVARDNICILADAYMTVRAERSRYLGPNRTYRNRANSTTPNNLNSDFFYQRMIDNGTVENLLAKPPPHGPSQQVKEAIDGYVAGYNRYLASRGGADGIPDPNCKGKPWVQPITTINVYRRFYGLALLASSGAAVDGIGSAQPPAGAAASAQRPLSEDEQRAGFLELNEKRDGIGSNAYGLGREATADGHGMVLGNPHFPWEGSERLYQAHLTIPGVGDVEGASLLGVPVILIGHTRTLAWSHTVSGSYRFTPFQLTLVPGSPTSYLYDGKVRRMKEDRVTVQALNADGTVTPRTRTLYSSHHGPIFTSIVGVPLFPWTQLQAHAMGDANAANFRYLNHFFEVNRARSVRELHQITIRNQGIPWVTTTAADRGGEAYFADIGVVPNVTNAKADRCAGGLAAVSRPVLGLPVLDGSRSACEWDDDPDSLQPGTFGPSRLPHVFRNDYVTNSNDSHWLTNPEQPIEGYPRIVGAERTLRSLRTRLGIKMVQERLAGADGRPGNRFTLRQLQDTVFNNRNHGAELLADELIAYCRRTPVLSGSGGPVPTAEACDALAKWDRRDDLDSRGAVLWRRFAQRLLSPSGTGPVDQSVSGAFYDTQFSLADPVNTPRGLNTEAPAVATALGDAITDLRRSGIPLDASLRNHQYRTLPSGERVPIHGGPGGLGIFNAISAGWVPGRGFPEPSHGGSFVMAAHMTPRCPTSRMIVTYSQSTNPLSPHYGDMTRLYSHKVWPKVRFCEKDVLADPALRVQNLNGGVAALRVTVTPRRIASGRRTRVRILVTYGTVGLRTPVGGATVRIGARRVRTRANGRASLTYRQFRRGRVPVVVTRRALGRIRTSVRVGA